MTDSTAQWLGATGAAGSVPVLLFIPALDRDGAQIDQAGWTDKALAVLGGLFGGATALPAGRGVWRDDERDELLHESTVVIFTLIKVEDADNELLFVQLGDFLRAFGREAGQGEVGIVVANRYHAIRTYDK